MWGATDPNQSQGPWCSDRLGPYGSNPGSRTWGSPGCHVRASSFPTFLVVSICLLLGEAAPPGEATLFHLQLCQAVAGLCSMRATPAFPQLGDAVHWQKCLCVPLHFHLAALCFTPSGEVLGSAGVCLGSHHFSFFSGNTKNQAASCQRLSYGAKWSLWKYFDCRHFFPIPKCEEGKRRKESL